MARSTQKCPCCKRNYPHKTGLYNHLTDYVGEWRLPADGVHDVVKCLRTLRRLNFSNFDEEIGRHYRCWTCAAEFKSRWRFQEHVIYCGHCSNVPRTPVEDRPKKKRRRWTLPFDEEHVLVKDGNFPFLKLSLDLRMMIYGLILGFGDITLSKVRIFFQEPRSDGRWLQHNPETNALAIMSTNHQIYNEARSFFYRFNTFIFQQMATIPVFLVGIGVENAMLLRSVKCTEAQVQPQHLITEIKACVMQDTSLGAPLPRPKPNWDFELLCAKFSTPNVAQDPSHRNDIRRFVRPIDMDPLHTWFPYRHSMTFTYQNVSGSKKVQGGVVTYELCVQRKIVHIWQLEQDDPIVIHRSLIMPI